MPTSFSTLPEKNYDDPFHLESFLKTPEFIKTAGKRNKNVAKYYEKQNELIHLLLTNPGSETLGTEQSRIEYKIAMYGSLFANISLFLLQFIAAILSSSLVLFATTADAFMDVSSSLVLIGFGRLAQGDNYLKFPTGKEKYKTAGIVVFATLMSTLALQLVVESVKKIIDGIGGNTTFLKFDLFTYVSVGTAFVLKVILYIYCRLNSNLESVAVLAQDHRNDVMFNTTAVVMAIVASYTYWWIDPLGAILIAFAICKSWFLVGQEQVRNIVGKAADPIYINRYIYLAMTHDPRIEKVDTCRVYHSGSKFFVEIDVMFPPNTLLKDCHDVGESLQVKIELLDEVDRCFVHLDYETDHKPEHRIWA